MNEDRDAHERETMFAATGAAPPGLTHTGTNTVHLPQVLPNRGPSDRAPEEFGSTVRSQVKYSLGAALRKQEIKVNLVS